MEFASLYSATIENNSWIKFKAAETSITFTAWASNCTQGFATAHPLGIQLLIVKFTPGPPPNNFQLLAYADIFNDSTGSITASGLTIGADYYLMLDGIAGDHCDYVLQATQGISAADAGPDTVICLGEAVTLSASGGSSFLWNTGATNQSIYVSPINDSVFTVIIDNNTPTCGNDTLDITVLVTSPPIALAMANPDTIASGQSVSLTASGGTAYLWSNGSTSPSIFANPLVTTTYSVTVTSDNGCTDSTSVTVVINAPLPVELYDFDAHCNSLCQRSLSWVTLSESNSKAFLIQKSTNGIDHWQHVAMVPARIRQQ